MQIQQSAGIVGFLDHIKTGTLHRKNALERIGFDSTNDIEIDRLIRAKKVSVMVLKKLKKELEISEDDILSLVNMTRTTIARRRTLKSDEAGRVFRIASLLALSEEVLGSHHDGIRWLKSPCHFLENETPLNLAKTEAGANAVKNLLFRIEHSVYA